MAASESTTVARGGEGTFARKHVYPCLAARPDSGVPPRPALSSNVQHRPPRVASHSTLSRSCTHVHTINICKMSSPPHTIKFQFHCGFESHDVEVSPRGFYPCLMNRIRLTPKDDAGKRSLHDAGKRFIAPLDSVELQLTEVSDTPPLLSPTTKKKATMLAEQQIRIWKKALERGEVSEREAQKELEGWTKEKEKAGTGPEERWRSPEGRSLSLRFSDPTEKVQLLVVVSTSSVTIAGYSKYSDGSIMMPKLCSNASRSLCEAGYIVCKYSTDGRYRDAPWAPVRGSSGVTRMGVTSMSNWLLDEGALTFTPLVTGPHRLEVTERVVNQLLFFRCLDRCSTHGLLPHLLSLDFDVTMSCGSKGELFWEKSPPPAAPGPLARAAFHLRNTEHACGLYEESMATDHGDHGDKPGAPPSIASSLDGTWYLHDRPQQWSDDHCGPVYKLFRDGALVARAVVCRRDDEKSKRSMAGRHRELVFQMPVIQAVPASDECHKEWRDILIRYDDGSRSPVWIVCDASGGKLKSFKHGAGSEPILTSMITELQTALALVDYRNFLRVPLLLAAETSDHKKKRKRCDAAADEEGPATTSKIAKSK